MADFDVVVLGGGPGGYAAALYGASAGLNVAMVEEGRVGGTCLHVGCIPAKELLQTAEVYRTVGDAASFGVNASAPTIDMSVTQVRKQQVIDKLTSGLEGLLKHRKVTVVPGTGTLDADGHTVRASDGTEVRGANVVLATGSSPRALPLPGLEYDGKNVMSSDHVLQLDRVPERVAVIGGGAIGCEFASFLVDVGSEVTVLEALPQLLTGVDKQVAQAVVRAFTKRGMKVQTNVKVAAFDAGKSGGSVRFEGKDGAEKLDVDIVVVSVGRRPRSENVGYEEAGVKVDERGFVAVDGNLRTSADGVYAVGDLVATPQLAHVAFAEAIVAIKTILGENPLPIRLREGAVGHLLPPRSRFLRLDRRASEGGWV